MKKFWALLLALCLLGGFALGECPRFALEDYPRVDGSTSMLPLSRALMMASTGAGAQEQTERQQKRPKLLHPPSLLSPSDPCIR